MVGARPNDDAEGSSPEAELQYWNCYGCRKRKIRCNRRRPCSHCEAGGLSCSFPTHGKPPTRRSAPGSIKKPQERQEHLMAKLERLEQIVQDLSDRCVDLQPVDGHPTPTSMASDECQLRADIKDGVLYVDNGFWASLHDEADKLSGDIDDDYDGDIIFGDAAQFPSPEPPRRQLFDRHNSCLQQWSPLPSQMPYIWKVYVDNIDQCLKVVHKPTISAVLKECEGNINVLSPSLQALMWAMIAASVVSLDVNQVALDFGQDKECFIEYLAETTERALVQAGLFGTCDLVVLQAAVIYLDCLGSRHGPRSVWSLAGMLTRTAMSMGLHRDGATFPKVSPFCAEMRRRLWWNLCFIDLRFGDAQTIDVAITEKMFDTLEPSNINDEDLHPDMKELPVSRKGFADSSFCLVRCELWHLIRRVQNCISVSPRSSRSSVQEELRNLRLTLKRLEETILHHIDANKPMHHLLSTLAHSNLARAELLLTHLGRARMPIDLNDASFDDILYQMENANQFKEQREIQQWAWIFQSCIPWDTIGIMALCLSKAEHWGERCERGWRALSKQVDKIPQSIKAERERQPIWRVMRALSRRRTEWEGNGRITQTHVTGLGGVFNDLEHGTWLLDQLSSVAIPEALISGGNEVQEAAFWA